MSISLMAKIWKLPLRANLKFVLLALADHARDDGSKCFPSVGLVARKCSCSQRSVQRQIRKLESLRLIVAVAYKRGGRGKATEYRVLVENLSLFLTKAKHDNLAPFEAEENSDEPAGLGDSRDAKGRQAMTPQPSVTSTEPSRSADSRHQQGVGLRTSLAGRLESNQPKPLLRKTRTEKREEGLRKKAERSYDGPLWQELETWSAKERAELLKEFRQACRRIHYKTDLANPLLSLRFVWRLIDTVEDYEGKDILPGILATKVIDECQKADIVWPLDFQNHRKGLRNQERLKGEESS